MKRILMHALCVFAISYMVGDILFAAYGELFPSADSHRYVRVEESLERIARESPICYDGSMYWIQSPCRHRNGDPRWVCRPTRPWTVNVPGGDDLL